MVAPPGPAQSRPEDRLRATTKNNVKAGGNRVILPRYEVTPWRSGPVASTAKPAPVIRLVRRRHHAFVGVTDREPRIRVVRRRPEPLHAVRRLLLPQMERDLEPILRPSVTSTWIGPCPGTMRSKVLEWSPGRMTNVGNDLAWAARPTVKTKARSPAPPTVRSAPSPARPPAPAHPPKPGRSHHRPVPPDPGGTLRC